MPRGDAVFRTMLGSLLAVTVVAGAVGLIFAGNRSGFAETIASVVGGLVFAVVGALIVRSDRRNHSLSEELVTVVGSTMQPAHASLWLRPKEEASV